MLKLQTEAVSYSSLLGIFHIKPKRIQKIQSVGGYIGSTKSYATTEPSALQAGPESILNPKRRPKAKSLDPVLAGPRAVLRKLIGMVTMVINIS